MDIRNFNKPSGKGEGTVNDNMLISDSQEGAASNNQDNTSPSSVENPEVNITSEEVLEEYLSFLKENGFDKDDIQEALDSIITQGTVVWEFDFLNKVPVVFRMRPYWVNEEILKKLEQDKPTIYSNYTGILSKYNLAGTIHSYNGKEVFDGTLDSYKEALKFVEQLPFIVQARLVDKLSVFDRLVAVATSDWAIENFTNPQQEN